MKEEERKKERKKEENRILSRLEREATNNIAQMMSNQGSKDVKIIWIGYVEIQTHYSKFFQNKNTITTFENVISLQSKVLIIQYLDFFEKPLYEQFTSVIVINNNHT